MNSFVRSAIMCGATLGFASSSMLASITTYTTYASWSAAAGSHTTETFTGNVLTQSIASFSFQGSGHENNVGGAAGIFNHHFEDRIITGSSTTWTFSSPASAVGADWDMSPNGAGHGLAFEIRLYSNNTLVFVGQISNTTNGFFGFKSTDLFDKLIITAGSTPANAETYNMDNLVFDVIPLPTPALLAASGLMLLAVPRRRRAR